MTDLERIVLGKPSEPTVKDWWEGYEPVAACYGPLPAMGHPDCRWCFGTGARSVTPYRHCYCNRGFHDPG